MRLFFPEFRFTHTLRILVRLTVWYAFGSLLLSLLISSPFLPYAGVCPNRPENFLIAIRDDFAPNFLAARVIATTDDGAALTGTVIHLSQPALSVVMTAGDVGKWRRFSEMEKRLVLGRRVEQVLKLAGAGWCAHLVRAEASSHSRACRF